MAYLRFHNVRFPQYPLMAQVAFRTEMAFCTEVWPVVVEVQWFLCAFSVSVDSLQYHFGMEVSRPYHFYKPLLGVFLSQPAASYVQKTQLLTSSLLRLQLEVS